MLKAVFLNDKGDFLFPMRRNASQCVNLRHDATRRHIVTQPTRSVATNVSFKIQILISNFIKFK